MGGLAVGCQSIGVSMSRGVEEYIEIQHFDDHSETNHVLKVVDKEDYNFIGKTGNALKYGIQGIGNGFQRGIDHYKAYRGTDNDDDDDSALIDFMETCQSTVNGPIDAMHKIMPAIIEGFFAGCGRGWRLHKGDEDQEIIYAYILEKRLKDRDRRRQKLDYKPEVEVRHTDKGGKEIIIDSEYMNDDSITTDHILETIDVYEDMKHNNMSPEQTPKKIDSQPSVSMHKALPVLENLRFHS